jgi:hypothetical protein
VGPARPPVEPPGPDRWGAWTPEELRDRLGSVPGGWYVAGGWALDLWHGFVTRDHEDLEFCILRERFATFRAALRGFDLFSAGDGQVSWLPEGEDPPADVHQLWGLDREARAWRFDMMIEPGTETTWRYKRDASLARPRSRAVRVARSGIPYLDPALVLLFKAKHARPKDEVDLRNALPGLPAPDRQWLAEQVGRYHPGHHWLGVLRGPPDA